MSKTLPELSGMRAELSVGRSAVAASVDPQNPWLGLASFSEETRAYFHGRDDEVGELSRRVQRKLLTILFGQSGLGKTSILRAGVVPKLRLEGYCPVYVRIDYGREAPLPSEQIKQAVLRETAGAGTWTRTGSAEPGESLWEFLHHREDTLHDRSGRTLIPLLIFDQFEEIFTLAQSDDFGRERGQTFLKDLADLVENRPPAALEKRIERDDALAEQFDFARADYRVLIALREDYLAPLEGLKHAMPAVTQNRMRLARMTGNQAIAAVTGPGGALVTEDVAKAIVRFVSGAVDLATAEVEPSLLSLVCRELNNQRIAQGHAEISDDLLAGSRETILVEFYERTIADQTAGVRAFIEDHLLTDAGYRESMAEERVKKGFAAAGADPAALAVLVDRRLLRVEERLDVRRVELTHDVLCPVVKASRDARQERESKAAVERQLAATRANEVATKRALWRARVVATACAVIALAAVGSAIFGYQSRKRAVAAEQQAQAAAAEAATARRLADAGRAQAESVMGYMLTDLQEELTNLGHPAVLLEVSQKTVDYYHGLPKELMTATTQIAKGNALANLAHVLSTRDDLVGAASRYEQSMALFQSVENSGELTLAARIDYAHALYNWSWHLGSEARIEDASNLCDRAEKLLGPVLSDPVLRGRALRQLSHVLAWKGWTLGSSRTEEAALYYRRAIAAVDEADTLPPLPRRPGLWSAFVQTRLASAIALRNPTEARTMVDDAKRRLEGFLEKEPFLASAKSALASVFSTLSTQHVRDWEFQKAEAAREQVRKIYEEMLKLDPKHRVYMNNRAVVLSGRSSGFAALTGRGEFAHAETTLRQAIAELAAVPGDFEKRNLANAYRSLAVLTASVGQDIAADEHMKQVQTLVAQLKAGDTTDSPRLELDESGRLSRTPVEAARLNWSAVRADSERELGELAKGEANDLGDRRIRLRRRAAAGHLMAATWATGDYPAALMAMKQLEATDEPLPPDAPIDRRLTHVSNQLERIHVVARAGDLAEARTLLDALWPEVEAVFARAPEELFTKVEMARALWIKAEIAEGVDRAGRLALLERAAGYLRPLATAGKLTRFNREVILGGIEKQIKLVEGAK